MYGINVTFIDPVPLSPVLATIVAQTFLAITRQPLEVESCPSTLQIREVF